MTTNSLGENRTPTKIWFQRQFQALQPGGPHGNFRDAKTTHSMPKGDGFVGDLDRAAQRGWEVGAGYRWPLVSSHRRCLVKAKSQLWLINVDYNLRRFLVKLS